MGPDLVLIRGVIFQDGAQVRFAEHDHMVEGFATSRSNEPLDIVILPRQARCGRMIADPHCANSASIGWTLGSIALTNQVPRRFIPGKGIKSHDLQCTRQSDRSSR